MSIIEKLLDKLEKDASEVVKSTDEDESPPERDAGIYEPLRWKGEQPGTSGLQPQQQEQRKEQARTRKDARHSRKIDLDLRKLKKAGYLVPDTVNITLAEQYRRIKRPILNNAFEAEGAHLENRNLVMVTSAVSKEGKSFSSMNLALSIAREFDRTALFIDADIIKHTTSNYLGLEKEPGLTDFLMAEKTDLSDYLLKTNIPNLTILPAGTYSDATHELWATEKMQRLMTELSSRYHDRMIIFDASPVLQDSSTQILARLVGQVVFVIEAEKTPQQLVTEALQSIAEAQYIGLVLNKSNKRLVSEYGYYNHVNFPLAAKIKAADGSV